MTIGKAQSRQVLTDVRNDCGHRSAGPSVVFDQSNARMRRAISLVPGKIPSMIAITIAAARWVSAISGAHACNSRAVPVCGHVTNCSALMIEPRVRRTKIIVDGEFQGAIDYS